MNHFRQEMTLMVNRSNDGSGQNWVSGGCRSWFSIQFSPNWLGFSNQEAETIADIYAKFMLDFNLAKCFGLSI